MKKTKFSDSTETVNDLRPEYRFDYCKARPNRFAGQVSRDQLIVVFDSDISKVFKTSEEVNTALRALMNAIPKTSRRKVVA